MRLIAFLATLIVGVASFVSTAGAQSAQPRVLVNGVSLGPGASLRPGSGADSTIVSPKRGGMYYLVTESADSLLADSLAVEVIPFAGIVKAVGGFRLWAPIDLNTSNGPKLDGWFCTTLDSTTLSTNGNLTPLAVAGPHFPYRVSSLVVPGQYIMPSGSMALPGGAMAAQFGFGTADAVDQTRRTFAMPIADGFGVVLDGMARLSAAIINRHPRATTTCWLYYIPGHE